MKTWEIDKVNELYTQIDRLTDENTRLRQENVTLKHNANVTQSTAKLDRILELVEEIHTKPARKSK